jgi:hypothetical protein
MKLQKTIMQFREGELVLILDTLNKPAGTARILGYNKNSTLYAVSFRYPGATTDEEFEIPERRILIHENFSNPEFAA